MRSFARQITLYINKYIGIRSRIIYSTSPKNIKEIMIIAVDFDGTLVKEGLFSDSLTPNIPLIKKLKIIKSKGHNLILWTCRGDKWLKEAIDFCNLYGLEFDAINENIKGYTYTNISCKVVADLYIDDKSPGSIQYFMDNF